MEPPTRLLPSKEYLEELTKRVKNAHTRVYIIALVVTNDESTTELMDAIVDAVARDVKVSIASDLFFTYRELGAQGSRLGYIRAQVRQMYKLKRRIEKRGGRVTWLGHFGMTFFSRRTHTKWSIVDDTVFVFGGVNLYYAGIANNDFMLQIDDKAAADWFMDEQTAILRYDKSGRSQRNHTFGEGKNIALIDGGMMGDSLIYRKACSFAKQAKSIVYVSQYPPTGRLGKMLKNTSTKYYFNRWQNAKSFNRAILRLTSVFRHQPNSYRKKKYLHAKFIIFTMQDGSKIAITGSHNYLAGGGLMGTREVALKTRDEKVIAMLEKFHKQYIA